MQFAVLSDVHSNLEALTAALDEIDRRGIEQVYCLGDVVGYGADAAACVDLVQSRCAGTVRGNHDEAVALDRGLLRLPPDGQAAALHNRAQLSEEQRSYLASRPLCLEADGYTFVHASPEQPEAWRRLTGFQSLRRQFDHFTTDVCFVGHTHVPGFAADRLGVLNVRRGHRYLVNAGSVGQPRDGNPDLSFVVFDSEAFSCAFVRLRYDVDRAAAKILEAGLPPSLAHRLTAGR